MDKEFLSIDDVSKYLGIKRSTLYLKVEKHEIPFYRFGRLIRFKRVDVERWTEGFKCEIVDVDSKASWLIENIAGKKVDVDEIVKKAIDESRGLKYTPNYGRPDQVKGRRKEVEDGTL